MHRKRSGRLEYTFWGRRQPGDVTLEESAENLKGGEMLLSGAQGLFERKRVALRAALPLNNSSDS